MARQDARQLTLWNGLAQSLTDFGLLVKFRLTLMVNFSAVIAYATVSTSPLEWFPLVLLSLGGFFVTGAANALNQGLEREYDRLMPRTANRPVAAGRMTLSTAVLLAGLMAMLGISALTWFNPLTGFLGTLSLISYAFVYTPLKRVSPLSVVVGAFPGALPVIIGGVAFEGTISPLVFYMFLIQFLWQFPHYWAIAWLADDDYKRAGFYMLPTRNGQKDASVGLLSLSFCALLIANSAIGFAIGLTSLPATLGLMLLNVWFGWRCWQLYRECSHAAARRQMFASFLHLPLSLLLVLIDKI
ncbi:MAG: protoheme IX farnesyltransferase [Saprospiraceae bacterium]|nr:protoheme IX farnesyltransferase [Saprospiraceae bacterium]